MRAVESLFFPGPLWGAYGTRTDRRRAGGIVREANEELRAFIKKTGWLPFGSQRPVGGLSRVG